MMAHFKDHLTLDVMSRRQLVSLCDFLGLRSFAPDPVLRFQLRTKLRQLRNDDKDIMWEGVESLTAEELHAALRARGMPTRNLDEKQMQAVLREWVQLSQNQEIPSCLLLLSNVFRFARVRDYQEAEGHPVKASALRPPLVSTLAPPPVFVRDYWRRAPFLPLLLRSLPHRIRRRHVRPFQPPRHPPPAPDIPISPPGAGPQPGRAPAAESDAARRSRFGSQCGAHGAVVNLGGNHRLGHRRGERGGGEVIHEERGLYCAGQAGRGHGGWAVISGSAGSCSGVTGALAGPGLRPPRLSSFPHPHPCLFGPTFPMRIPPPTRPEPHCPHR